MRMTGSDTATRPQQVKVTATRRDLEGRWLLLTAACMRVACSASDVDSGCARAHLQVTVQLRTSRPDPLPKRAFK
eukprot:6187304-Pleurochrysis_carterae.AAC.1